MLCCPTVLVVLLLSLLVCSALVVGAASVADAAALSDDEIMVLSLGDTTIYLRPCPRANGFECTESDFETFMPSSTNATDCASYCFTGDPPLPYGYLDPDGNCYCTSILCADYMSNRGWSTAVASST